MFFIADEHRGNVPFSCCTVHQFHLCLDVIIVFLLGIFNNTPRYLIGQTIVHVHP